MSWTYSEIKSMANPPCPRCGKNTFVVKLLGQSCRYCCRKCQVSFVAVQLTDDDPLVRKAQGRFR